MKQDQNVSCRNSHRTGVLLCLAVACLPFTLAACGTLRCATIPYQRNMETIQVGDDREGVLAEVGQPDSTKLEDGRRIDVFDTDQMGPKPGARLSAIGLGFAGDVAATVVTFGIYPLAMEWGIAEAVTLYYRAKDGGAEYEEWTLTYDNDDRVTVLHREVKQSRFWPKDSDMAKASSS